MSSIIQRLSAPYPCFKLAPWNWSTAIYMGAAITFIVAILLLNGYPGISQGYRLQFGATFGLSCMLTILLIRLAGRALIGQSLARRWTVIHEIGWEALNFLIIGIVNMLVLRYLGLTPWSWLAFFTTAGITVAVGLPPLLILILFRQNRLLKKHLQLAAEITASGRSKIQSTTTQSPNQPIKPESSRPAEVQKINLAKHEIEIDQILFLEANRNYLRIVCRDHDTIPQVRLTMQAAADLLTDHPQVLRCHRAFMVNLDKVTGLTGNSQGLLLEIEGKDDPVPVSRAYVERVRKALVN